MSIDEEKMRKYKNFLKDLNSEVPVYLVSVPDRRNYEIAKERKVWGVPEEYGARIKNVKEGEYIIFFGAKIGLSIYQIKKGYYYDKEKVWEDDIYPHRVGLSDEPIISFTPTEFTMSDLKNILLDKDGKPYENVNAVGGALRGANGIFRPLKPTEKASLIKVLEEKINKLHPSPLSEKDNMVNENNNLPRNIILYGPVGTGKTYLASILARKIVSKTLKDRDEISELIEKDLGEESKNLKENYKNSSIEFNKYITKITFHPSYGYEEFVEGIYPKLKDGNGNEKSNNSIEYIIKKGIFREICDEAKNDPDHNYVLIIDEINRGDISRIFGELITTIEEDKRCEDNYIVKLPFSGDDFCVPRNLFIIGTMNNTDRSIALLDIALRRRFVFFYIPPSYEVIEKWLSNTSNDDNKEFRNVFIEALKKLNKRISKYKGEDFQIGHGLFSELKTSTDKVRSAQWIFKYKIIPLLMEYFYGENELLRKVLGNVFIKNPNNDDEPIEWNDEFFKKEKREDFIKELQKFINAKEDEEE